MRKILLITAILFSFVCKAQENHKYVIIPSQFSFFKDPDKYNLNTLTKSFFESEGFKVLYDTQDLPQEIANNRCDALYANAIENNSMFLTRIKIEIKDCQNKVILTSIEGSSKEKSYDKAYNQAFRSALTSLKGKLKVSKTEQKVMVTTIPVNEEKQSVLETIVTENQPITDDSLSELSKRNLLYALPIDNGYKLVDNTPRMIFELQKTSFENIYLAVNDFTLDKGIFYKKNDTWYFEYYKKGKLVIEIVEVKF